MDEEKLNIEIGKKIKYYRKKHKMTQAELAKKAHISLMTMRRYEAGERGISLGRLYDMSKVFDIDVSVFFPNEISSDNDIKENIQLLGNYFSLNEKMQTFFNELDIKGREIACDIIEGLFLTGKYMIPKDDKDYIETWDTTQND